MNDTAKWVAKHWDDLEWTLRTHFHYYFDKAPVQLEIDDWVQSFVAHLIEKDLITRYVAQGSPLKNKNKSLEHVVSYWGYRYVCTLIRKQGMDMIGKLYGQALTTLDRVHQREPPTLVTIDDPESLMVESPVALEADRLILAKEVLSLVKECLVDEFPTTHDEKMKALQQHWDGESQSRIKADSGIHSGDLIRWCRRALRRKGLNVQLHH